VILFRYHYWSLHEIKSVDSTNSSLESCIVAATHAKEKEGNKKKEKAKVGCLVVLQ
jgi:hypothetical protein